MALQGCKVAITVKMEKKDSSIKQQTIDLNKYKNKKCGKRE
jgi:hypothetical protein